jgi:hypothetical protein
LLNSIRNSLGALLLVGLARYAYGELGQLSRTNHSAAHVVAQTVLWVGLPIIGALGLFLIYALITTLTGKRVQVSIRLVPLAWAGSAWDHDQTTARVEPARLRQITEGISRRAELSGAPRRSH